MRERERERGGGEFPREKNQELVLYVFWVYISGMFWGCFRVWGYKFTHVVIPKVSHLSMSSCDCVALSYLSAVSSARYSPHHAPAKTTKG